MRITIDRTEAKVGDYIVFETWWPGKQTCKILRIENGYFINTSGIRFNVCNGKSEYEFHSIIRYERDNDNMYAQVGDYTKINGDIYKVVYEHNGYCVLRGIKGNTIVSVKNKIVNIHSLPLEDRIETEIINVDSSVVREYDIIIYKDIDDKEYIGTVVNLFDENIFTAYIHNNDLIQFINGISICRKYKIVEYKRCIIKDNFLNKVEIGDTIITEYGSYIVLEINKYNCTCVEKEKRKSFGRFRFVPYTKSIVSIHKDNMNLLTAEIGDSVEFIHENRIRYGEIIEIEEESNIVTVQSTDSYEPKFNMIDRYCIDDKKIRIIDCYKIWERKEI